MPLFCAPFESSVNPIPTGYACHIIARPVLKIYLLMKFILCLERVKTSLLISTPLNMYISMYLSTLEFRINEQVVYQKWIQLLIFSKKSHLPIRLFPPIFLFIFVQFEYFGFKFNNFCLIFIFGCYQKFPPILRNFPTYTFIQSYTFILF